MSFVIFCVDESFTMKLTFKCNSYCTMWIDKCSVLCKRSRHLLESQRAVVPMSHSFPFFAVCFNKTEAKHTVSRCHERNTNRHTLNSNLLLCQEFFYSLMKNIFVWFVCGQHILWHFNIAETVCSFKCGDKRHICICIMFENG